NAVRSALADVKKAMATYRATVHDESLLSNAERSALSNGDRLADAYAKGLETAKQAVADGKAQEEIAKSASVNDMFGNVVFRPLHNEVSDELLDDGDRVSDSVAQIDHTVWQTAVIVGIIAAATM